MAQWRESPERHFYPVDRERPTTPPLQVLTMTENGTIDLQQNSDTVMPLATLITSPQKSPRTPFKFATRAYSPKADVPTVDLTTPPRPPAMEVLVRTPPRVPLPALIPLKEEPQPPPGVNYTMGGVSVQFPLKAYPSQVAIMSKVINGLRNKQNCLLESPTGSGKTLALLCSALAWQKHERDILSQQRQEWLDELQRKSELIPPREENTAPKPAAVAARTPAVQPCSECSNTETAIAKEQTTVINTTVRGDDGSSSDDDFHFKPAKKRQKGILFLSPDDESDVVPPPVAIKPPCGSCACKNAAPTTATPNPSTPRKLCDDKDDWDDGKGMEDYPEGSVPKIFYGTRTHKQIQQVVKELKRTIYKDVQMTILSSRTHTCIHPEVKGKSKTELCHELLDPRHGLGCRFKNNVERYMSNHRHLANLNCPEPFDIEDLVSLGQKVNTCPYFSARSLMAGAELIFCPYNYLIDPHIVDSMSIQLADNVIIFDEAHNIEDMAKESASYTVDQVDIRKAADDCKVVAINKRMPEVHRLLEDFLVKLAGWIDEQEDMLKTTEDHNKYAHTWTGLEAIASFENYQIGQVPYTHFRNSVKAAITDIQNIPSKDVQASLPCMTALTKNLLQAVCFVLDKLYDNNMAHLPDYRIAVIKQASRRTNSFTPTSNRWINVSARSSEDETSWQYTLNFWCQNPAIAMTAMREKSRCVILTSGTLAPVDSFSSELGMKFPIQFEANHVISSQQVYVTSVPFGPHNKSLNAQWTNAETFDFQDELGCLVLDVCETVPHGVLCFFPSYKLLEKLSSRWKATGLWTKLELCKNVFSEPRFAKDLDGIMDEFKKSIVDPTFIQSNSTLEWEEREGLELTGALMFAVHRGKISEGIDFADNQARAVIAVGIPYPNFKDEKVVLKRQYNNDFCRARGLLSGKRWYEIQAYRALNQALGRCIRHRNDWGAILLVDDRFAKSNYYTDGLSKWVRKELRHRGNYNAVKEGLKFFVETRLELMELEAQEC